MKVENALIDSIIPYARNPRHNDKAIDKVAASLKEFGFRQPIVVDSENVVIAGHTRLLAAKKLKLKQVPIHKADGLTDAQVKAYRLADNRVSQESDWDFDLLAIELGDLGDIDPLLTGFNPDEIADILGNINFDAAGLDEQGDLTSLDPQMVCCPDCGYDFDARENKTTR